MLYPVSKKTYHARNLDSLLNRNLDITLLVGGPGHHHGLRDWDLNELGNNLSLNALRRRSAILSAAKLSTKLVGDAVKASRVTIGSRSGDSVRSGGHLSVFAQHLFIRFI